MSMADQYDDGRYDGITEGEVDELLHPNTWAVGIEAEVYHRKTDQWLPGGDPRLPKYRGVELASEMNPGYIEMPGGWCVPAEQAPEPFTFPRIQRGGIKYPTPTKETHMPEKLTKAQIEHELRVNSELLDTLHKRRADLNRMKKTAIPAEPPNYTMFTVSVRFKMRGQRYQFLILKSAGHYWTTGTKRDQQVFSSWESLCEWLEGPDVYDHTDIEILQGVGRVVSFDTGKIEAEDYKSKQVPF